MRIWRRAARRGSNGGKSVRKSRGIVLVLTAGVLVLLSLVGTAMLRMALQLRTQVGVTADQAAARLLARSGISCAAARLYQDPAAPSSRVRASQPDDWTCRDDPATPLEKIHNP